MDKGFVVPDLGPTNLSLTKIFDHIALTGSDDMTSYLRGGAFDWRSSVYRPDEAAAYKPIATEIAIRDDRALPGDDWPSKFQSWSTSEMSDHLPIWIEILTDFSDDYLERTSLLSTDNVA